MITVTERARQELKKILTTSVDMPQSRLRLLDRGQGNLGLGIDIEMPSDVLVDYDGSTVMVIEHGLATSLKGVTLDVDGTEEESEIVVYYNVENMVTSQN